MTDGEYYLFFKFVRAWGASLSPVQIVKGAPMKIDAGLALFNRMRAKVDTQMARQRWHLLHVTKNSVVDDDVLHRFEPTDPERVCILDDYEERLQPRTAIEGSSEPQEVRDQATELNTHALTVLKPATMAMAIAAPVGDGRARELEARCPCALTIGTAGHHRVDQVVVAPLMLTKRTRSPLTIVEWVGLAAGGACFEIDDVASHEAYPGRWLPAPPFEVRTMMSGNIAFHVPPEEAWRIGDDARIVVRFGPKMGIWGKSVKIVGATS